MISFDFSNWCCLPTRIGEFRMYDCRDENFRVVCKGDLKRQGENPLVRIHSSCMASEIFGALDCDCADQLSYAMEMIGKEGVGIVFHIHQEGRGHGLSKKIEAVSIMQRQGLDTAEAFNVMGIDQDIRDYGEVVSVLRFLGISKVRLISNNPRKRRYLEDHGISVESVNTLTKVRKENEKYLITKKEKLGHNFHDAMVSEVRDEVRFYHSDQKWGFLSNFSRHAIFVDDRIWPTVEHFYQAQKFSRVCEMEAVRTADGPGAAKDFSREMSAEVVGDWNDKKEKVMMKGLRAKFEQHPELKRLLLDTGNMPIIENSSEDDYWGSGVDGHGKNRLGELLMQLRAELSK